MDESSIEDLSASEPKNTEINYRRPAYWLLKISTGLAWNEKCSSR